MKRPRRWAALALLCACVLLGAAARAEVTASDLFNATQALVYQVRVIDIGSGDKYSIGSGFAVSAGGLVATNFHVVSSFVHEPEKYRLELVRHDGTIEAVRLVSTDVIHDLALLEAQEAGAHFLPLAVEPLAKGDRIYSMGNPHDLGMTIIEGTYNGLVENSRYRKILFSGSLNAGMSGGPALNTRGQVMGINVSKGGEQLSFLVPVDHLRTLLERSAQPRPQAGHQADINAALVADQDTFYRQLIMSEPYSKSLGGLTVPGKLAESLRCWGHSVDEEDEKYVAAHQHCRSEDRIYVSSDLNVGDFAYSFELIGSEGLNRFQFYKLLETRFAHPRLSNTLAREQVGDFECHVRAVDLDGSNWKISSCMRAYKKYTGLFDASMAMVSIDDPQRAAMVTVSATGVSAENAIGIFRRITEGVRWNP